MGHPETDCRALLARLYLYLDGEIQGNTCADIERHLQECHDCVKRCSFERELKQIVRAKCREQVPPGLVERVRTQIRDLL